MPWGGQGGVKLFSTKTIKSEQNIAFYVSKVVLFPRSGAHSVSLPSRRRDTAFLDVQTMAMQRRAKDPFGVSPFAAMPAWIRPMLASPADIAPDGPAWLHEVKQDGHRLQVVVNDGAVTLRSR